MTKKTKLLFVYDHFYPAYKAGGPIQSLTNLTTALKEQYDISVITSAFDLNAEKELENITINEWLPVTLPGNSLPVSVYYAGIQQPTVSSFKEQIKIQAPDIVYLNGMFSFRFVMIPLIALKNSAAKVIVCPRGMLQAGALAGKSLKKKAYLSLLKISGLMNRVQWHATNEEEVQDIKKIFGRDVHTISAGNIPKKPLVSASHSTKIEGRLRLIYLSLISEKKNLLQAIEVIVSAGNNISLDIYGPVKDEQYWNECKAAIEKYPGTISYKGDLQPETVQETFANYDASILLTRGENFGHALYECLSAGRPVITSFFTPWNELEQKRAGWNFDIGDNGSCIKMLQSIAALDAPAFDEFCRGAHQLAGSYYSSSSDLSHCQQLFSIN